MQLSEHLVRLGFTLPLSFPATAAEGSLSARDVTTDAAAVTQFHHTVQVARSVVEKSKRDTMIQVSQGTLTEILSKIKALEGEVDAMLRSQPAPAAPAPEGAQRASNADDCAPEKLLMDLGASAIKSRDVVGEHPLFRRTDKCNYSSVAGGTAKAVHEARPKGAAAAPVLGTDKRPEGGKKPATATTGVAGTAAASTGPTGAVLLEQMSHANGKGDPIASGDLSTDSKKQGDDTKVHLGGDVYSVDAPVSSAPAADALPTVTVTSTRKKMVTVTVTTTRTNFVSVTGSPERANMVDASTATATPSSDAAASLVSGILGAVSSQVSAAQASVDNQVSSAEASASGQVSSALGSVSGQISSAAPKNSSLAGGASSTLASGSNRGNATYLINALTPSVTPTAVASAAGTPISSAHSSLHAAVSSAKAKAGLLGNIAGAVSSALDKGHIIVAAQGTPGGDARAPFTTSMPSPHNATHAEAGKKANPKSEEDKKDSKAGAAAVPASPAAPTGSARAPMDVKPNNGTQAHTGLQANPKSDEDKKDSKAGSAAVTASPKRAAEEAKAETSSSSGFVTVSKRPGARV